MRDSALDWLTREDRVLPRDELDFLLAKARTEGGRSRMNRDAFNFWLAVAKEQRAA